MEGLSVWDVLSWFWIAHLIGLSLYGYWQLRVRENLIAFTHKEVRRLAEEKKLTTNTDGRLRAVSRPLKKLEQEEGKNQNGEQDNSVILAYIDKLEDRLKLIRLFNRELDQRLVSGWLRFVLLTVGTAYLLLVSTEYFFSSSSSLWRAICTARVVFLGYANEPFALFYGQPPFNEAILEGGKASFWANKFVSFVIPSQLSLVWFALNFFKKPRAFEENILALKKKYKVRTK